MGLSPRLNIQNVANWLWEREKVIFPIVDFQLKIEALTLTDTSEGKLASSWHHILCENCQRAGPKVDPEAPSSGAKGPR